MRKHFTLSNSLKLLVVLVGFGLVPLAVAWLIHQPNMSSLLTVVQENLAVFVLGLILLKAASIVYPPLPGMVVTAAAIPVFGWQIAYLIDLTGSVLGGSIAFLLGRHYGKKLLLWAVGSRIGERVLAVRLKQRNQVESALMLRLAAGGMLSDGLAWGGSLIGFKYWPFIIGYAMSHMLTTAPLFYVISRSLEVSLWIVYVPVTAIVWYLIYRLCRYFD